MFHRFIFWLSTLTLAFPNLSRADDDRTLRVVTFNIHHGEGTDGVLDLERVARVLQELQPDVVALQEVDCETERAGGVDQIRRLAELTKWHAVFGRSMPYQGGRYGNAVLSRFPLSEKAVHPLPFREGQEPRSALMVTVTPSNGVPPFRLISTHLSYEREDVCREQVGHLLGICQKIEEPVVIAGDMNARPTSSPMERFFEAGWEDQVAPDSVIDYVLTHQGDPWSRSEAKVIDDRVTSDHRPVLVALRWDDQRGKGAEENSGGER